MIKSSVSAGFSAIVMVTIGGCLSCTVLSSCSEHSGNSAPASPDMWKTAPMSTPSPSASNSPELTGEIEGPAIMGVDPKTGRLLWKAKAKSMQASSESSGGAGVMHSAIVTLYQHGEAEALVRAPLVSGNTGKKTISASGGVTVHSLVPSQIADARCDNMVWSADTNVMVGTGHVVIKVPGTTETGPSFKADTKLESVEIPAPGLGSGVVKATINDIGKRLSE
jgi:hypothetical protein